MTKTVAAFVMSARALFAIGKPVYFWTFTFTECLPDWWYPAAWRKFSRDLGHLYGGNLCGLRVIEPHEEHGLHYHALINKRINIHMMRRLGARVGMFWIGVERVWDEEGAIRYLIPYLKPSSKVFHVHRWGTMGAFKGVKKNAVVYDTAYMRARRRICKDRKVVFGVEHLLRRAFEVGGYRRMKKCYHYLRLGKTSSACMLVSPNVELTEKGGLRYLRAQSAILWRSVKSDRRLT